MVVVKQFGVDFHSSGGALTLYPSEVHETCVYNKGYFSRTHSDGWTVEGEIKEDYFYWVNDFEATHPKYGRVWGNFESEVYADSEEGFVDFYLRHTPKAWDYRDI